MSEITGRAIRWSKGLVKGFPLFTKWHYARSENFTGCGLMIPEYMQRETESNARLWVDCTGCLRRHEVKDALAEKF